MCRRVEVEVLPVLVARFGQHIWIDRRDVENPVDLSRLLGQLGRTITNENPRVCVVVSGRDAFVDDAVFSSALEQTVSTRVSEAMNGGAAVPLVSAVAPPEVAISQAYRRFGWGLVLVAGLVDGINPCAIGTLVFFVSLLAAGKAGKGRMAAAGLAFCLGVYVTYVVLGFGLLRAWRAAEALPAARFWLRTVLAGTLAVLAALSFRDAAVFSRSGNASAVRLKLPRRLMEASHRLARRGVTARWLLPACMVMGVAVTLIGTVCTGQAYIPALAFMARQGSIRATAMLLSYNAMFVLPLVAILVAVLLGWRSVNMAAWTRREVVVGKVALGLLFVAMGVVIWVPW